MRILHFIILLSFGASLNAASYYVSTNGSDIADGSVSTPWLTLQKALDTVAAGDTVNLAQGRYAGSCNTVTAGTSGSPITIAGPADTNAVITGRVTADRDWYEWKYLAFDGDRIDCDGPVAHNWLIHHCTWSNSIAGGIVMQRDGPTTNSARGWRIVFNIFDAWTSDAAVTLQGAFNIAQSNRFQNVQAYDCFRVWGESNSIVNNVFADLFSGADSTPPNSRHADIVQFFDGATLPDYYISRHNLFAWNFVTNSSVQLGNTEATYGSTNLGPWLWTSNTFLNSRIQINNYVPGFTFTYNTVLSNDVSNGLRFTTGKGTAHNGTVMNNLFVRCLSFYGFNAACTNMTANFNLFTSLTDGTVTLTSEGADSINGGYSPDDVFVDWQSGNLNIKTNSPAVGAASDGGDIGAWALSGAPAEPEPQPPLASTGVTSGRAAVGGGRFRP